MNKSRTVIITGGAGFLGSRLCEMLIENGDRVTCVDNFFTGSEYNISELRNDPNFNVVRHDVVKPFNSWEFPASVDRIYNLACPASPPHYQHDPIKTTLTSVLGSVNALNLAKHFNARILQASTSEVYGDPRVHPQKESYNGNVNTTGPRACYDEGKRVAETLFMDYNRTVGTNVRIVRIFNTYGPNMHPYDGRVVSNFIRQALSEEPLTVYGNGSQTRSLCYRDDLLDGMIKMMENDSGFMGPVNLGNESSCTMLQLAELIKSLTYSKSEIIYEKLPQDDPSRRQPNTRYAEMVLDWKASTSLKDGLRKTISWFQSINFSDWRSPTPNS